MIEAIPWDTAPRCVVRDRDGIYGGDFMRRVKGMGIEEVVVSARSPWQNPYAERVIGSIRRECFAYYHCSRTHLGLEKDCPVARRVEPPERGRVCEEPMVGGLHHRYFRSAV